MSYHGVESKVAAKSADPAYTEEAATDGVTEISGETSRDLVERHKLGTAAVQEIKPGKSHTSVEFGGDWQGADFSALAKRLEEVVQDGSSNDYAVFPDGTATPKVQFDDVVLSSWRIESGLDGLCRYAVSGIGKSVTITP